MQQDGGINFSRKISTEKGSMVWPTWQVKSAKVIIIIITISKQLCREQLRQKQEKAKRRREGEVYYRLRNGM